MKICIFHSGKFLRYVKTEKLLYILFFELQIQLICSHVPIIIMVIVVAIGMECAALTEFFNAPVMSVAIKTVDNG